MALSSSQPNQADEATIVWAGLRCSEFGTPFGSSDGTHFRLANGCHGKHSRTSMLNASNSECSTTIPFLWPTSTMFKGTRPASSAGALQWCSSRGWCQRPHFDTPLYLGHGDHTLRSRTIPCFSLSKHYPIAKHSDHVILAPPTSSKIEMAHLLRRVFAVNWSEVCLKEAPIHFPSNMCSPTLVVHLPRIMNDLVEP